MTYFGLAYSNKNVFYSISDLYDELTSHDHVPLYRIFTTWCLIIKYESLNTLYVPQCKIFSDSFTGASM